MSAASIIQRLTRMQVDDSALSKVLVRIGGLLQSQIELNIRQVGLIDLGSLLGSIKFELYKQGSTQGVQVGSYGIPYAAAHEFGFQGVVTKKAHFRTITKSFGVTHEAKTIAVRQHSSKMNVRKRPYIRPAIEKHKTYIIDLIRAAHGLK